MAYHPGTGLAYVPVINNCAKFTSGKAFFIKGQPYWGSSLTLIDNQASGSLKAIDVKTGQIKWDVATRSPMVAGVLATGGGLVFTGDAEGFFTAYDAETGKVLWSFQCGSGHHASPITYTLDGRQYIAVCVGLGRLDGRLRRRRRPWLRNARRGNTLFVFALPKEELRIRATRHVEPRRGLEVPARRRGTGRHDVARPVSLGDASHAPSVRSSPAARVIPSGAGRLRCAWSCGRARTKREGPDRLRRAGRHAADRQGSGRHAAGPRRGRGAAAGPEAWAGRSKSTGAPARRARWNCLREGRCDVILGQPHDSGPPRTSPGACPTPAASSGWWSPRDAKGVRSLADLRGKRVGIVAGTVALCRRRTTPSSASRRARSSSTGSQADKLDAAFLDADFAAWHLHEHPEAAACGWWTEYVPREHWNMALAVRAKDADCWWRSTRPWPSWPSRASSGRSMPS